MNGRVAVRYFHAEDPCCYYISIIPIYFKMLNHGWNHVANCDRLKLSYPRLEQDLDLVDDSVTRRLRVVPLSNLHGTK